MKNESILSVRVTSASVRLSSSRSCNTNTELAGCGSHITSQSFGTGVLYAFTLCTEVSAITARIAVRCIYNGKNIVRVIFRSKVYMLMRLGAEQKD